MTIQPWIDPVIAEIAPEYQALSIQVHASNIVKPEYGGEALQFACTSILKQDAIWAAAHLEQWADVFRAFGVKPQRTPCSAEALRQRVFKDRQLQSIDPIVDLYNAVSIQYAIPIGGENLAAYKGHPRLTIADGTEIFDTIKNGQLSEETPSQGEVIWRDDLGVTCRRWNWRQGLRTRLDSKAQLMWFILESLPAMPESALFEAGERLIDGLGMMMPKAKIESSLIHLPRKNI